MALLDNDKERASMEPDQEPKALPSPFQRLQLNVAELNWRWKVYKDLFHDDPLGIAAFEEWRAFAQNQLGCFFALLQSLMIDDILIRIGRISDGASMGVGKNEKKNNSLRGALKYQSSKLSPEVQEKTKELIEQWLQSTDALEVWRNKKIAHDDLLFSTGQMKLPPIKISDVDEAITKINTITAHLDPDSATREFGYTQTIANQDGNTLKYLLRLGDFLMQERKARGEYGPPIEFVLKYPSITPGRTPPKLRTFKAADAD